MTGRRRQILHPGGGVVLPGRSVTAEALRAARQPSASRPTVADLVDELDRPGLRQGGARELVARVLGTWPAGSGVRLVVLDRAAAPTTCAGPGNRQVATARPGADSRVAPRGGGPRNFHCRARGSLAPAPPESSGSYRYGRGWIQAGPHRASAPRRWWCGCRESISGCHFQRDMVDCTFKGAGWPTSRRHKRSR